MQSGTLNTLCTSRVWSFRPPMTLFPAATDPRKNYHTISYNLPLAESIERAFDGADDVVQIGCGHAIGRQACRRTGRSGAAARRGSRNIDRSFGATSESIRAPALATSKAAMVPMCRTFCTSGRACSRGGSAACCSWMASMRSITGSSSHSSSDAQAAAQASGFPVNEDESKNVGRDRCCKTPDQISSVRRDGQRQESARKPLRQTEDVRRYAGLLAGEPRPFAPSPSSPRRR